MASNAQLDEELKDYMILYRPKDVVSGDFYWCGLLNNGHFSLLTADSTGHGVPGAIMSLLNITSIEKAVEEHSSPALILDKTRSIIVDRLRRDGSKEGGKDGMDCSLIVLNKERTKLTYAAAHNPVWLLRNGTLTELAADKMPVGKHDKDTVPFTEHSIELQKGDLIYTLTDGFADQFGGPQGKKFKYKQLADLILKNSHFSLAEQAKLLEKAFFDWKGDLEQVDDVCVIGIRV